VDFMCGGVLLRVTVQLLPVMTVVCLITGGRATRLEPAGRLHVWRQCKRLRLHH